MGETVSSDKGEEGKQLEEALSKQKSSYEQYMKSQEERLMAQVDDLRQKHESVASTLEETKKNTKVLEEELSSSKVDYQTKIEEYEELVKEKDMQLENTVKDNIEVI